jgi:hypothetical protein
MWLMARHNPGARDGRRPRSTPCKVARTMPKTHGRRNAQNAPEFTTLEWLLACRFVAKASGAGGLGKRGPRLAQALPLQIACRSKRACRFIARARASSLQITCKSKRPVADPLQKQEASLQIPCRSKQSCCGTLAKARGAADALPGNPARAARPIVDHCFCALRRKTLFS